jgi:uncharacterized protein
MPVVWIEIKDIPAEGREFSFSDQETWTSPCEEFGIRCRVLVPLEARFTLLPQEDGVLVRGRITGEVALPCDRCAEDAAVHVDRSFDEFEVFPEAREAVAERERRARKGRPAPRQEDEEPVVESSHLVREGKSGFELDAGTMLWEQFLLALPVKPLCDSQCKGLCETCGSNRNREPCRCEEGKGDPRLAVLRSLKIK